MNIYLERFQLKTVAKTKHVRCFFKKSKDGYYGRDFQVVNEKEEEVKITMLEWPYKYNDGEITYKLVSHTKDIESRKIQERAISVGVRAIGLHVKNIKFKRERNRTKKADIEIHFNHDDPVFKKNPQVLAYAYFVQKDYLKDTTKNKIMYNDNHFWTIYGEPVPAYKIDPVHYKKTDKTKLQSESILSTFLHEFMHRLGLQHDLKDKNAIMWAFAKPLDHPNAFILHKRDVARLQKKYGKRDLPKRVIARMRKRRLEKHDFKRLRTRR